MELKYENPKIDDLGFIYSLDLLRLTVELSGRQLEAFLAWIDRQDNINKSVRIDVKNGALKYKYMVLLFYKNGGTVKMGFQQNDVPKEQSERGFVEFNPNALAGTPFLTEDWPVISQFFCCLEVTRYDLAIDMPIRRDLVAMEKDQRKYSCQRGSALDFTEYLGRRNNTGRVKLYNKQHERKLAKPLTRLEVTGDLHHMKIPSTYDLRNLTKSNEDNVKLVLHNDNISLALSTISNYRRNKIRKLLKNNKIAFDKGCIEAIRQQAEELAKNRFNISFVEEIEKRMIRK